MPDLEDDIEDDDLDAEADSDEELPADDAIDTRIGTVDIPDRTERGYYFKKLTYLELSALFAGPQKQSGLAKWAEIAPPGSLGLVAPWVLTHRKAPPGAKLWAHDATVGDFRDSGPGRVALAELAKAIEITKAAHVIFKSPPQFSASQANRDALAKFFGEIATSEALHGAQRVWVPDGLWDLRTAVKLANELGVLCSFDPLIREPGHPPEVFHDLGVPALYLRVAGIGRTGPLRAERLEDLVLLLEHYEGTPATIAFESPARWQDARNLRKVLASSVD